MPKKKVSGKDKRVHAAGPVRPLCGAKSTKVTRTAEAVTCDACGAAALRVIEEMAETAEETRQEAALAAAQPPRWWVKDQVLVAPGEAQED